MSKSSLKPVILVLTLAGITLFAAISVLGDGGLQAKLNQLKKIYAEKQQEYDALLETYKNLENEVNGLLSQLMFLRIGVIALGVLVFAVGFYIGYKHEQKVEYR
ncbi:MAG: hypothetical protein DRJ47_04010 [Thermoprotei archaeon]|nr:MAG: hypothetical protein DRJ47_04010 [Thermoprotei archaeon]